MEPGVEYELSLGQTLFGQPADYCALRYRDDFKPSQACRSGFGNLRIHGNHVALELPNAKASQFDVQFEGALEHGKDGMDYVLVYNGQGFTLEALTGHVHDIRHIRSRDGLSALPTNAQPSSEVELLAAPAYEEAQLPELPTAVACEDAVLSSQPDCKPRDGSSPAMLTAQQSDATQAQPLSSSHSNTGTASPTATGSIGSSSSDSSCNSDYGEGASVEQLSADQENKTLCRVNPEVHLSEEERHFLGIPAVLDGQTEFI